MPSTVRRQVIVNGNNAITFGRIRELVIFCYMMVEQGTAPLSCIVVVVVLFAERFVHTFIFTIIIIYYFRSVISASVVSICAPFSSNHRHNTLSLVHTSFRSFPHISTQKSGPICARFGRLLLRNLLKGIHTTFVFYPRGFSAAGKAPPIPRTYRAVDGCGESVCWCYS